MMKNSCLVNATISYEFFIGFHLTRAKALKGTLGTGRWYWVPRVPNEGSRVPLSASKGTEHLGTK